MKHTWFTGPVLAAGLVLAAGMVAFANAPRAMVALRIQDAPEVEKPDYPALRRLLAKHRAAAQR